MPFKRVQVLSSLSSRSKTDFHPHAVSTSTGSPWARYQSNRATNSNLEKASFARFFPTLTQAPSFYSMWTNHTHATSSWACVTISSWKASPPMEDVNPYNHCGSKLPISSTALELKGAAVSRISQQACKLIAALTQHCPQSRLRLFSSPWRQKPGEKELCPSHRGSLVPGTRL